MSGGSGPLMKKRRIESQDSSDDEQEQECFIQILPDELLVDIFQRLFFKERLACGLVCQRWFGIVRSRIFMCRTKVEINHAFGYLIDKSIQRLLSNCGHIFFNDCPSMPGCMRGNLIPAHKAIDQPGPSTAQPGISMEDFLFSGQLPARKLTVSSLYRRILEFVRGRLHTMKNLEEFHMNILLDQEIDSDEECDPPCGERYALRLEPLWTIKHDNVRSLTVLLYGCTISYALELPLLRRLVLEIDSDNELETLMRYSKQLEELVLLFYFSRGMEQSLTYPYPKLRTLRLKFYGPNESPDPNTRVDDASADRFINSAPLLEDVTLCQNIITVRLFRAVCLRGAESLRRLTLLEVVLPQRLFALIVKLKKLEFLKLEECLIDEGGPVREVDFPMLRELILLNSGTCMRIDRGLSGVTKFKYTIDPKLSKVCKHMVQLEDFEIKLRANYPVAEYVRDHIHSLPMLGQLHTLRLNSVKTTNRPWAFCHPMPAVEHLVLRKCYLVRGDFSKLPKLFPSLRMLELERTIIAYKHCPADVRPLVHFRRRLKQFFPACNLVLDPECEALPIATVLEMEDERAWNRKHAIASGLTLKAVSRKRQAKMEAKKKKEILRMQLKEQEKKHQIKAKQSR